MDTPTLTSGRRAIKDPIVENLNVTGGAISPLRYHYIDDSLKVGGRLTEHVLEGEGDIIGFDVKSEGVEKGSMNLQLDLPTDTPPLPGHRLRVTIGSVIKYYGVAPEGGTSSKRNDVRRPSPGLIQEINPFFKNLLSSAEGDLKRSSYSIAGITVSTTFDPEPVNFRSGSTKAYSATQEDGSALPAGVAINAGTGIITLTAATLVAGVYTIKVVVTETLAGFRTNEGESTWVLTVTA